MIVAQMDMARKWRRMTVAFTTALPSGYVLRHIKSILHLHIYLPEIRFNIIVPSTLRWSSEADFKPHSGECIGT